MQQNNVRDNRGMSLVEVIIAITILGLVAVPVLHSMTSSMVYNAKARTRQEMTLTAESIMETFKGYELDELVARFGGTAPVGIEGISFKAVDSDSGYSCTSSDTVVDAQPAKEYTFQINDMQADNEQLYDVIIKAVPNSVESIVEMEDMEPTRDAVFRADRKFDTEAVSKAIADFGSDANKTGFKSCLSGEDAVIKIGSDVLSVGDGNNIDYLYNPAYPEYYVGNNIKLQSRKITFDIIKNDSTDEYIVKPKLVYSYCLVNYQYFAKTTEPTTVEDEYEDAGGTGDSGGNEEKIVGESRTLSQYPTDGSYLELEIDISSVCTDDNIYKNPTAAGLNRLIVYYYPQYELSAGNDKIVVNNQANISDFQCFILKQRAADINDNNTKIKENSYKATVQVNSSAPGFEVFHNFDDNIADGSSTTSPGISGASGVYSYTKALSDPASLAARYEQKEVLSYSLELIIMQDGRTVTKLESSMNEKIK